MTEQSHLRAELVDMIDSLDEQPDERFRSILLDLTDIVDRDEQPATAVAFRMLAVAIGALGEAYNEPSADEIAEGAELQRRLAEWAQHQH